MVGIRVFVSRRPRDGYTQEDGIAIWSEYLSFMKTELIDAGVNLIFGELKGTPMSNKLLSIRVELSKVDYAKAILVAGVCEYNTSNLTYYI